MKFCGVASPGRRMLESAVSEKLVDLSDPHGPSKQGRLSCQADLTQIVTRLAMTVTNQSASALNRARRSISPAIAPCFEHRAAASPARDADPG
jgi:hypothetical protein